ncbi:MAG: DUF4340 domain-containing protein [Verrucomicrobiota bacterium]
MKPKHLLILVAIFGAALAAMYVFNQDPAPAVGDKNYDDPLFDPAPDLRSVTSVRVKRADSELNLEKKGDVWVVADRDDFPANFEGKLRNFVTEVAELKVVRPFEIGASDLGRVGLKEPSETGDSFTEMGSRVEFLNEEDKPVLRLLVGGIFAPPATSGGAAGGTQGRYVKLYNETEDVYVVSNGLYTAEDSEPRNWLEKQSFVVENPKSVKVTHPGEDAPESFKIEKEDDGGEWTLAGAQEGEELDTSKMGNLGTVFNSESFYDVLVGDEAKDENTGLDQPIVVNIETFDDFSYEVKIGKDLPSSRRAVVYTVKADIKSEREVEGEETDEEKEERNKAFAETKKRLEEKLAKEKTHEGRIFVYQDWIVTGALKKRSEILVDPEGEGAEAGAGIPGGIPGAMPMPAAIQNRAMATTPAISVQQALQDAQEQADAVESAAEAVEEATEAVPSE